MKKMILKRVALLLLGIVACFGASAQSINDIVINEILVTNTDSYEDDYGHRSGWVELFNKGYSSVNVAGSYLAIKDSAGKIIYYNIPKNDPKTIVPPQGYVVFFCDGKGSKGTFYTNFTLNSADSLYMLSASKRFPAVSAVAVNSLSAMPDLSTGWRVPEAGADAVWATLEATTPGAVNDTIEFETRAELFLEQDPVGITMALTAMSVVFIALILLYQIFKRVGIILVRFYARKEMKAKGISTVETTAGTKPFSDKDGAPNAEVMAVIGMALYKYMNDMHDRESAVLTINRAAKVYSPWSSKLYGMTPAPERVVKK